MATREFRLETFEVPDEVTLGLRWQDVANDHVNAGGDSNVVLTRVHTCQFGAAEEVIALMFFSDHTFEVGQGESLRPYQQLYSGSDARRAFETFWNRVDEATR